MSHLNACSCIDRQPVNDQAWHAQLHWQSPDILKSCTCRGRPDAVLRAHACSAGPYWLCCWWVFQLPPHLPLTFISGLLRVAWPMQGRSAPSSLPMPNCFDLMDGSCKAADSSLFLQEHTMKASTINPGPVGSWCDLYPH